MNLMGIFYLGCISLKFSVNKKCKFLHTQTVGIGTFDIFMTALGQPVIKQISAGPTGPVNIKGHSCLQVSPQECPQT